MGMVMMSKRELNRLDVLARLDSDRLTARAAAELMAVTLRQTYRLLRRYRDGGASAIANQRRGRPSNIRPVKPMPRRGYDREVRSHPQEPNSCWGFVFGGFVAISDV